MSPAALHRAVRLATRLATTGEVTRARAVIAALPPMSSASVVIEVNKTVPVDRSARRSPPVSTRRIPYVRLGDEAEAWIVEMRAARGER